MTQHTTPVDTLRSLLGTLPKLHHERPGIIRSIEVLTHYTPAPAATLTGADWDTIERALFTHRRGRLAGMVGIKPLDKHLHPGIVLYPEATSPPGGNTMSTTPTRTVTIKTRSKAAYALVKAYYEKGALIPGTFKSAEIVGYAYSASPAVVTRARRAGAKLVRIENGAATCEVRA